LRLSADSINPNFPNSILASPGIYRDNAIEMARDKRMPSRAYRDASAGDAGTITRLTRGEFERMALELERPRDDSECLALLEFYQWK
jgi:stalled ribosome rescue protein Dom34